MKRYILAHDLGTSGNKATLFDSEGKMVTSHSSAYETNIFNNNWAEQNPADWWKAVCDSSRAVLTHIDPDQLGAVSFSGQMMACLPVNRQGKPLHDALIYCDQRAVEEEQTLVEGVGFEEIYRITGHRPSASYSLEKLMWLKKHKPGVFGKTFKMLQAKDYMNYRLTGRFVTDYNDASGTQGFDLSSLDWSGTILESAGIDRALMPDVVPSTEVIGEVTAEAFRETGIPAGTPVVAGAGDGGCATVGAGSTADNETYCYSGTSSWISNTTDSPLFDPEMRTFTFAHPVPGLYHPCGTMQTAGNSQNWFSRIFKGDSSGDTLNRIDELASRSKPGSGGVLFLPYLLGERTPWWNPEARGSFIGMTLGTTEEDMCRAVAEGIAMNLNCTLNVLKSRKPVEKLMFIGGGARSRYMRQIMADVFQVQLEIPEYLTEATSMGAAVIGGVGSGIYRDFSIVKSMNPVIDTVSPDVSKADVYGRLQEVFLRAYRQTEPLFTELAGFSIED